MSPFHKLWLYECWAHEQELDLEKEKNIAILIGSFYNPEMAKKMYQRDRPQFQSSDEDFEKSYQMVLDDIAEEEANAGLRVSKRKKRKIING